VVMHGMPCDTAAARMRPSSVRADSAFHLEIRPGLGIAWHWVRGQRAVASCPWSVVSCSWSVVSVAGERGAPDVPESPTPTATPSYQCNTPAFYPLSLRFRPISAHNWRILAECCTA
jgi:hypothetical protein